jgi:hydroxymethylpyrimidine kinase/phosphomethylpyrimidine kinase/thiamine-phosphate diphosphorylase
MIIFDRLFVFFLVWHVLAGLIPSSGLAASMPSTTTPMSVGTKSSSSNDNGQPLATQKPIVYTIAGSDSGGGAGIQADLHAIRSMGCHGCSAITCLTAQNSRGVSGIHVPPTAFLKEQLESLKDDLFPRAIKIGMLGTRDIVEVVGAVLKELSEDERKVWIVVDPVMISTSGSKLLEDDAIEAMIEHVFPYADIITPNKFEAEALLQRKLMTTDDIEEGARELLKMGCRSVLLKGGHIVTEEPSASDSKVQSTLQYAQDYLLSSDPAPTDGEERMCDASALSTKTNGVWMRSIRWETQNTHGTGCTLSSVIASALALGEANRNDVSDGGRVGATSAMDIVDACCLAKAYVSAGIQKSVQLGAGPGPVAQTEFPGSWEHFPTIVTDPTGSSDTGSFCAMNAFSSTTDEDDDSGVVLGRIVPIVDTVDEIQRLAPISGVTDIQLRIKDEKDPVKIAERVKVCQEHCKSNKVNLWINDYWEAAIEAGCFGVHVGQEDLVECILAGGLDQLRSKNMALGISTHSYGELAVALGVQPTYISMGPVYATSSKKIKFYPQGLDTVRKWRRLIHPSIPFVTIGGINSLEAATANKKAGADCIAVISAITQADDAAIAVEEYNDAMAL